MNANPNSEGPLVSIVLNSFNTDPFIEDQIDSILRQTYKNFELIVCDDHSTDRTPEIINQFMRKDQRVRSLEITKTAGVIGDKPRSVMTFQEGFENCRGEFIATSDADDHWLPNRLQTGVDYLLAHPETDLVFTDSVVANEDLSLKMGSLQKRLGNPCKSGSIPIDELLIRNLLPGHVMLFRRHLLQKIMPVPSGMTVDSWTGLVASLRAPLAYVPEVTVLYRQHGRNVTSARVRGFRYYIQRCNRPDFLRDYVIDKSGQMDAHEKLLSFDGSEAARKAVSEKIANQKALFAVIEARSFPRFILNLVGAAWTILRSNQKYHFKQLGFLAASWGAIRKMKSA